MKNAATLIAVCTTDEHFRLTIVFAGACPLANDKSSIFKCMFRIFMLCALTIVYRIVRCSDECCYMLETLANDDCCVYVACAFILMEVALTNANVMFIQVYKHSCLVLKCTYHVYISV